MKNTFFTALLAKHENQIKAFGIMRLEAWQGLLRQERELLQEKRCDYTTATYDVWLELEHLRAEFEKNWGGNGRLIKELNRWQMREIQKIISEHT
ncbi:hypothetical protein FAM09_07150 [Niastella caeni]|uniref:Uncharacterized protein n=1 Tax=Niastella caeni TaxID=2569763 RepID=A0A4S8I2Z7_9BACT|nr:hypothetical protein [Niastella caeni]THU41869.1 hypothetical protein FAM09_07150 [Niastella caeni]